MSVAGARSDDDAVAEKGRVQVCGDNRRDPIPMKCLVNVSGQDNRSEIVVKAKNNEAAPEVGEGANVTSRMGAMRPVVRNVEIAFDFDRKRFRWRIDKVQ